MYSITLNAKFRCQQSQDCKHKGIELALPGVNTSFRNALVEQRCEELVVPDSF